jgi:antitoxin component of RelBE/YafQ-DinJ toxin-antitoxin module
MATTKTVKFHRHHFSIDDQTVAMAKEIADTLGLPVSSAIRMAIRQAYQSQKITIRKEPQSSITA